MTPEELDRQLRAITDHEQLYRRGIDPNEIVPARYTPSEDGIPRTERHASNLRRPFIQPSWPHLFVKQHSRFRDYPLHRQDYVELAYMYDGTAREVVNDTAFTLRKGQVLVVDSDTAHTTLPLGEDDILIVIQFDKQFFDTSFLMRLDEDSILASFFVNSIAKGTKHDGYLLFHSETSRRLPIFMTEFLCEWYEPSLRSTEIINDLLALIAAELTCVHKVDVERGSSTGTSRALDVLRYIERTYRTCTLKEAASSFGMAPDSLSRMLKRETGKTFGQLVRQQRVSAAKALLAAGDLPVTGVGKQVGYENMTHFYRIFEEAVGASPGAYRRQVRAVSKREGQR